jgi:hypothetical protein
MRASLLLCDYAAQDAPTGKVHVMGAGWSVTAPVAAAPRAVAVFIKVGWTEANEPHKLMLRLIDADGQVVSVEGPAGKQPLEFQGNLEVGRPPGIPQGSEIDASFVINLTALPLVPGQRFTWELEMDGSGLTSESFYVRPLPTPSAPPSAS